MNQKVTPRNSVVRVQLPGKLYIRMIEERSPTGLIDQKIAKLHDIREAVRIYHEEEKAHYMRVMNFDGDLEAQRQAFEAERGIYEISFKREWNLRNLKVVFCNIENIVKNEFLTSSPS